ncbi:MAG: alpha/beta hydrolase [Alistipes sp.]|jgi:pimeloyl-ACP methyl ester carboxylesterase|nr:alpha/beta hydrolase [Alistipes sp.]
MRRFLTFIAPLAVVALSHGVCAQSVSDSLRRPQEPLPPFPYLVEEVVFENREAGIKLAGTLTLPSGGDSFPAVVLVTGSGSQNRDEELFGHKPFLVLADHFTRRGIAVLRFDDRGVGGSESSPAPPTTADLATDAVAALDFLRTRREIDLRRTGILGHSEGGDIAFIAAARHPDKVAFVISMAGLGLRGNEALAMQVEDILLANGMHAEMAKFYADKQQRDLAMIHAYTPEEVEAKIDSIGARLLPGFAFQSDTTKETARAQIRQAGSPWLRFASAYDPAGDISQTRCPVLAINGSKDLQVRASANLAAIRAALEAGGNTRFTVTEYPGLNHLFQTAVTGDVGEYATIEETISPAVPEDIANWILSLSL